MNSWNEELKLVLETRRDLQKQNMYILFNYLVFLAINIKF